jgi:hypothetical protein
MGSTERAPAEGQLETFAQEYLCQAASPQTHAFREEHFRFEDRPRTWEPVYVIYDPARTAVGRARPARSPCRG